MDLPVVQYIFRKPNPIFFSIEKVFATMMNCLHADVSVQSQYMPYFSSSIPKMMKNIHSVKKNWADIYHVTGDVHYVVLGLPGDKTILTIHDSVFIRDSTGLKKKFFIWMFLKLPIRKCKYVTTISEKSKEEILQYTNCNPDKIVVIPNPLNSLIYFQEKEFNALNPTLLFIGSTPNKNLDRVIKALAGITCTLKILGRIPPEHLSLLNEYNISFSQVMNLTEAEMSACYATSDIVIFPSLYEGFGLPILEGQQAGRAVLTSNIPPMNEVAGEGACLVDPYNVDSIRSGIKSIIEDPLYRESIIKGGFKNIQRFNTQAIADQYLKLYSTMLKQKKCAV